MGNSECYIKERKRRGLYSLPNSSPSTQGGNNCNKILLLPLFAVDGECFVEIQTLGWDRRHRFAADSFLIYEKRNSVSLRKTCNSCYYDQLWREHNGHKGDDGSGWTTAVLCLKEILGSRRRGLPAIIIKRSKTPMYCSILKPFLTLLNRRVHGLWN